MVAKTAVDRVGVGKKRDVDARFLAMTGHNVLEPDSCNPAAGREKGQVEKNVRDARRHAKACFQHDDSGRLCQPSRILMR